MTINTLKSRVVDTISARLCAKLEETHLVCASTQIIQRHQARNPGFGTLTQLLGRVYLHSLDGINVKNFQWIALRNHLLTYSI